MKTSWNDTFCKTFDTKQWSKDNKRCPNKKDAIQKMHKSKIIKKMGERELEKEFEDKIW
jgi:hypothetical protein